MKGLGSLAWRSAWSRRYSLSWVALSIALATFLMLSLEQMRHDVRRHFAQSVSGTDLIVGARTSSTALLLYSVFRIGNATQNIRWSSVQALSADPAVAWVIPISLGDSFRGYPVVATSEALFQHWRYGDQQGLELAQGSPFRDVFDAVVGAEVAQRLGLQVGQPLTLSHGSGDFQASDHDDKPFTTTGILARTGTPVDRSVHISLQGMEALHVDWVAGMPARKGLSADQARAMDLQPKSVTAVLVGLKSRAAVFSMQRSIAAFQAEPLMAILPGVALDELWQNLATGEQALELMVWVVAIVSLLGLVAAISAGLEQRRHELAVLRSLGAGPARVFVLLLTEGLIITTTATLAGVVLTVLILLGLGDWTGQHYGITVSLRGPLDSQLAMLAGVVLAGVAASALPGWRAYRLSSVDGLQPRQ
ncbi:MAG: FtsX-like permease family protein [Betaproteobacteria bacterium]|nr:FtsX-like permease family protein [Betaproteobacteria bacterium]